MGNEIKKYYTIGEVSAKSGVKQTVLRFWETEFEELHPQKNKFGHRVYTDEEIDLIIRIKDLLYNQGLTIRGAKSALKEKPKNIRVNIIRDKLTEILSELKNGKIE